MSAATQEWIEGDLHRLERQKQGYELALVSAPTASARERHLRNVARLDEEIAGRLEALRAVTPPRGIPTAAPQAYVDVTGPFAAIIDAEPGTRARRRVAISVAVAFGLGFVAVAAAMVGSSWPPRTLAGSTTVPAAPASGG